jgi:hypothetical protein
MFIFKIGSSWRSWRPSWRSWREYRMTDAYTTTATCSVEAVRTATPGAVSARQERQDLRQERQAINDLGTEEIQSG